jgi:hypothetical protein
MHLEECDSFLVDFIESACEQLKCKFPANHLKIFAAIFAFHLLTNLRLPGAEQIAALEKVSKGASSLWADTRCRSAVVLLQDRAQHIGEAVDGCQRALMTMYSIILPRNPLPGGFKQLLDVFRSSQQIHRLIELNLVAGAKDTEVLSKAKL